VDDRHTEGHPRLDGFASPGTIAVVGASGDPATIAGLLFGNLVDSGFGGLLLPVNPRQVQVCGITAYPDLASCPVVPDLVVVCVPVDAVADVVAQAGDLGVGAVCVISAGFAEVGPEGAARQARLVAIARERGVRLIGPNCTGLLGGVGEGRFNATFSRTLPPAGGAHLLSHSGAIGLAVLDAADARGLGIGSFVSIGNAADVSTNDVLRYWEDEPGVDVVLLYLESIPDPATFLRLARRIGRRLPIVAVKAGRTAAGRRGAASHTAALSGGDVGVDALLRQAGVIRAGSIEEMLDVAAMFSCMRRFRGRRIAIVTNGGGPGILAADACEGNGLDVPELAAPAAARLRSMLVPEASVSNPVDMIAGATATQYGQVTRILGADPDVDAVMVLFNTPLITRSADVAAELVSARAALADDVALVGVFMNREGPPTALQTSGVPCFTAPEHAARALALAMAWDERRRRPEGQVPSTAVDIEQVRSIVHDHQPAVAAVGAEHPFGPNSKRLLRCFIDERELRNLVGAGTAEGLLQTCRDHVHRGEQAVPCSADRLAEQPFGDTVGQLDVTVGPDDDDSGLPSWARRSSRPVRSSAQPGRQVRGERLEEPDLVQLERPVRRRSSEAHVTPRPARTHTSQLDVVAQSGGPEDLGHVRVGVGIVDQILQPRNALCPRHPRAEIERRCGEHEAEERLHHRWVESDAHRVDRQRGRRICRAEAVGSAAEMTSESIPDPLTQHGRVQPAVAEFLDRHELTDVRRSQPTHQ
jgi:acyl-CoA synthetase (NDP forming)